MEAAGAAILVLGAVCLIAAIIGGNVSLPGGTTFAALTSKTSRVVLASFAVVLFVLGFIFLFLQSPSPLRPLDLPDSTDSSVTKRQYTTAANEICRASTSQLSQIKEQVGIEARDLNDLAIVIEGIIQVRRDQLSQLSELNIPKGDESDISAIEDSLRKYISSMVYATQVLYAEDKIAAEDSLKDLNSIASEFNLLTRSYNLSDCVI